MTWYLYTCVFFLLDCVFILCCVFEWPVTYDLVLTVLLCSVTTAKVWTREGVLVSSVCGCRRRPSSHTSLFLQWIVSNGACNSCCFHSSSVIGGELDPQITQNIISSLCTYIWEFHDALWTCVSMFQFYFLSRLIHSWVYFFPSWAALHINVIKHLLLIVCLGIPTFVLSDIS